MDLFRCAPEYVLSLLNRADCGSVARPLKALWMGKVTGQVALEIDAVESLFIELVLVGGGE